AGGAAAGKEPPQHAAAERVGARQVGGGGSGEAVRGVRRLRRDRPEERTEDRERGERHEDPERYETQPGHAIRTRGSIRVYARSTARLARTAIAAITTVRPVTSG